MFPAPVLSARWMIRALVSIVLFVVPALADNFSVNGGQPPTPPNNPDDPNNPCPDCCKASGADPVLFYSGDFQHEVKLFAFPGRRLDVDIRLLYRSRSAVNGQFGYGWEFSYASRLRRLSNGNALILDGAHHQDEYVWMPATSTYVSPTLNTMTLRLETNGTHTLTELDGTKKTYDLAGNMVRVEDRFGNAITFSYSAQPVPITGTSPYFVGRTSGVIGRDYQLLQITDTVGRIIPFTYDASGRLASISYQQRTFQFHYDPAGTGDLIRIEDPARAAFPQGTSTQFTYYANHNLHTITDRKGQTYLSNDYDAQDRITHQHWGDGDWNISYFANETRVIDPRGVLTIHAFDASGRPSSEKIMTDGIPAGEPPFYLTSHQYDAQGRRIRTVWPRGNATEWTYNSSGRVLTVRRKKIGATPFVASPDDILTSFTYENTYQQVLTVTDPNGQTTTYAYDLSPTGTGLLQQMTLPTIAAGTPVYSFTYNPFGQIKNVTDPNGNVTRYTYDPTLGYQSSITKGAGTSDAVSTSFIRDAFGNVTRVTNGVGQARTYAYDELDHLVSAGTIPTSAETLQLTRDANGNVVHAMGSGVPGGEASYDYTTLNWLRGISNPLGESFTYQRNNQGDVQVRTNTRGFSRTLAYDERRLLESETDALGGVTSYGYDSNCNMIRSTPPLANSTQWSYDDFDRVVTMQYPQPSGQVSHYEYDKIGNLTATVDPAGRRIEYTYDASFHRRIQERWSDATQTTFTLTFDAGGRLLTVTQPNMGPLLFTYTHADLIASELSPWGRLVGHHYDAAGRLDRLDYPDGTQVSYAHDVFSRITAISDGATSPPIALIGYDDLGRRSSLQLANQTITRYTYDARGTLHTIEVNGGTSPHRIEYENDPNGNPVRRLTEGMTSSFAYDGLDRLIRDEALTASPVPLGGSQGPPHTPNYQYDANGNRTSATHSGVTTTYTSNSLDQYTSIGNTSRSYDPSGNVVNDGTAAFTFDFRNRLTSTTTTQGTSTYTYDYFDRRVRKTAASGSTSFTYSGFTAIETLGHSGGQTLEFVFGPRIDEALRLERSNQVSYYHADRLGSVVFLTDAVGQTVERYRYDSFGVPSIYGPTGTPLPSSAFENPLLFTGREFDYECGLYYCRLREYSCRVGSWLQRDPLGPICDSNLYRYVRNRPTTWKDPSGLGPLDAIGNALDSVVGGLGDAYNGIVDGVADALDYASDVGSGLDDLSDAYEDMRDANTIGADKYFHCLGHCMASQEGHGGEDVSELIGELRELFDEHIKGSPPSDCNSDRAANAQGRAVPPGADCKNGCKSLRPPGLNPKY